MQRPHFSILLALLVVLIPASASADKYDIEYKRLINSTNFQGEFKDQQAFDNIVRDLGVALAPKFMGPASTMGALGFDIAYEISWTDINEGQDYWDKALADNQQADDMLTTHQLHIRKGLPFSMEVGGTLGFLQDSSVMTVGMDLKYALLEGFRILPDFAIRSNIHTVLGANDVHMLLTGGDAILSKEFGLGGLFRVAPYLGYNLIYIYGSSHQITFFNDECVNSQLENGECSRVDLFDDVGAFEHRGLVGLQIVAAYISMGTEIALGNQIRTYTAHVGVDF